MIFIKHACERENFKQKIKLSLILVLSFKFLIQLDKRYKNIQDKFLKHVFFLQALQSKLFTCHINFHLKIKSLSFSNISFGYISSIPFSG